MRRATTRTFHLALVAFGIGCAEGEAPESNGAACIPGAQVACACPGGSEGAQICHDDGRYGECFGCGGNGATPGWPNGGSSGAGASGGASGSTAGSAGSSSCVGHCSNQLLDCGETGIDCGAECAACPAPIYTISDCSQDTPRNGAQEECDDGGVEVPLNPPPAVLVCINANGGVIYLAKNTGPLDVGDVHRCQGWENSGQHAWDHLDYIAKLTCDQEQKTLDVDVTAYAGQIIYIGAHTQTDGSGAGTIACVAAKK